MTDTLHDATLCPTGEEKRSVRLLRKLLKGRVLSLAVALSGRSRLASQAGQGVKKLHRDRGNRLASKYPGNHLPATNPKLYN